MVLRLVAHERAVVDSFAAKHMSRFGQMNSYLMSSAGLQFAFHDGVFPDRFQGANVRYCPLCGWIDFSARRFGSAFAVPSVSYQNAIKCLQFGMTMDNSVVFSSYIVLPENHTQHLCNGRCSGKYHQPTRIPVQSMDRNDCEFLHSSYSLALLIMR